MKEGLLKRLQTGDILLADGALGTMLQAMGLQQGDCPEDWNLTHSDIVGSIAHDYALAGSDIVYTNSFGGNRIRLAKYGLEKQVTELNTASVHVAKRAVGSEILIAGSIGPTGEFIEPLGDLAFDEVVNIFVEQVAALVAAGVDTIVAETFAALDEIKAVAKAVKENTDIPLICSMSFDTNRRTMMGVTPEDAVKTLVDSGADVVGANCGSTLEDTEQIVRRMREENEDVFLLAKPNAGLPKSVLGKIVYDVSPEKMAEYAKRYTELGANIVGGCCGSTPAHIAAIAQLLKKSR